MATYPHRFRLHRCDCDNHYHFILGPDNVSWPFWSKEAGLKLVDFSRSDLCKKYPDEAAHIGAEFDRLRDEVLAESRIQTRGKNGRFGSFLMPREFQPQEGSVASGWANFMRKDVPYACYIVTHFTGSYVLPLYCDFVKRNEPRPTSPLDRNGWIDLAEKPAQIVTMQELGIELDLAA